MQEWSESAKIAVDVFLAIVIVGALLVSFSTARTMTNAVDNQRATTADVQEYRVARMYDDAECYAQDIVALVLEYQGYPAVRVTSRGGAVYSWESGYYYTPITATDVSGALNAGAKYTCDVIYDANGSLSEFNFREV